MTKPTQIYVLHFQQALSASQWQAAYALMPMDIQQRIDKFRRWQDQHASLFGRLLLRYGLIQAGLAAECLSELAYTDKGRAYLPNSPIDFNISHAGAYVVCALSQSARIGIDIEKIKTAMSIDLFENYMTALQWADIQQAAFKTEAFFQYWTIKESAIKADGRGLGIPLLQIKTSDHLTEQSHPFSVLIQQDHWFCYRLELASGYACHLSSDQAHLNFQLKYFTVSNLQQLTC